MHLNQKTCFDLLPHFAENQNGVLARNLGLVTRAVRQRCRYQIGGGRGARQLVTFPMVRCGRCCPDGCEPVGLYLVEIPGGSAGQDTAAW
jgi:hypothetical protein